MAIDVTRRPSFYQACSGCRKEFFSKEEYEHHPCFAKGRAFDPRCVLGRNGLVLEGQRPQTGETKKEAVLQNSNPNTGMEEIENEVAVDKRLEAVKEITKMKQELVLSGIEAQTLTAEETKAEYAKLLASREKTAETQTQKTAAPATRTAAKERKTAAKEKRSN